MAGAKQHRLLLQQHALLARREHAIADRVRLGRFVARRARARVACRPSRSVQQRARTHATLLPETAFATARIGSLER